MIIAERSDTSVYISTTLFKYDLVAGATVAGAIYNPSNGQWLSDWVAGTWTAAKATVTLTENPASPGRYGRNANLSTAANDRLVAMFEVTAGGAGAAQEDIVLQRTVYDNPDRLTQYQGAIWVHYTDGVTSTEVGIDGTPERPVNNFARAATLIASTGIKRIYLMTGSPGFTPAIPLDGLVIEGSPAAKINLNGQTCDATTFRNITITGAQGTGGMFHADNCVLENVTNGWCISVGGLIDGSFAARPSVSNTFWNTKILGATSIVNINGGSVRWVGHSGYTEFTNMTVGGNNHYVHSEGGLLYFGATNTAGTLNVTGLADVQRVGDGLTEGTYWGLFPNELYSRVAEVRANTNVDIPAELTSIQGATFDGATDSLEAIRNLNAALDGKVDVVDANVDAVLTDTGASLPAQITALQTHGDANWSGGADVDVPALVDAMWDEILVGAHETPDSAGSVLLNTSAGGVDLNLLVDTILNAVLTNYDVEDSVASALKTAAATDTIRALLDGAIRSLRRYGPVAVKQPIATRDEIHVGDSGVILTIPVILDGAYSDLSQATDITFRVQAPNESTATDYAGMGVTTPTGSYTTLTSTSSMFDKTGRWAVWVVVTWPDTTTKSSAIHQIDIQPVVPLP